MSEIDCRHKFALLENGEVRRIKRRWSPGRFSKLNLILRDEDKSYLLYDPVRSPEGWVRFTQVCRIIKTANSKGELKND